MSHIKRKDPQQLMRAMGYMRTHVERVTSYREAGHREAARLNAGKANAANNALYAAGVFDVLELESWRRAIRYAVDQTTDD